MGICTHCGEDKKTTRDHDIAVCLWVETPAERAIKVPSCSVCNNRSEEGLLKSFLSLFDERLAQARLGDELLRPQGKGDLRSFVGVFRRRWPALSAVVVKSAWSRIVAGVPVGRVWVNPDAAVTLPPEVLAHLEAA